MDLQKIINQSNPTIIDVREPFEFSSGHAKKAINIPLGSIYEQIDEIKKMGTPIIVYCRSGMRSANAMGFLEAQGVKEVFNGGSYADMVFYQRRVA